MAWPPVTHQDVEDDLTNGHGWAASLAERFGIGEMPLPAPFLWTAGRYYAPTLTGTAVVTVSPVASRLYLHPIYFPTARSVDQLAVNVAVVGTATHVARLGIYNSAPTTGRPTTVKVDGGTVAVDATGVKTLTVSASLVGLYWLGLTTQSGQFTAVPASASPIVDGWATASGEANLCLARNSTAPTSALPNLTGDATVVGIAPVSIPRILVRAA